MIRNAAHMLSSNGRCKTLDTSATGYVRSDACVVSLFSFTRVCMFILLVGEVNQDGRSSSLTAPNGQSQASLLRQCYSSSLLGQSFRSDVLEMHGTGTSLGDPIEVGAALGSIPSSSLCLSSLKSFVGHSETGAGLSGFVILFKQMHQRLHQYVVSLKSLNSHVAVLVQSSASSSFYAHRCLSHASHISDVCCGGVSSFAFQGTNAHAVARCDAYVSDSCVCYLLRPSNCLYLSVSPACCMVVDTYSTIHASVFVFDTFAVRTVFLRNHIVVSAMILPGTCLFELSCACLTKLCTSIAFYASPTYVSIMRPTMMHSHRCVYVDMFRNVGFSIYDDDKRTFPNCSGQASVFVYKKFILGDEKRSCYTFVRKPYASASVHIPCGDNRVYSFMHPSISDCSLQSDASHVWDEGYQISDEMSGDVYVPAMLLFFRRIKCDFLMVDVDLIFRHKR